MVDGSDYSESEQQLESDEETEFARETLAGLGVPQATPSRASSKALAKRRAKRIAQSKARAAEDDPRSADHGCRSCAEYESTLHAAEADDAGHGCRGCVELGGHPDGDNDSDESSDDEDKSGEESSGDEFVARSKRRTKELSPELVECARFADEQGLTTKLPKFGKYSLSNFQEFDSEWKKYTTSNHASYRYIHTLARASKNKRLLQAHKKKKVKAVARDGTYTGTVALLPKGMTHFEKTARCVHGCTQSARPKTNERYRAATRYTGCQATIHAKASLDDETGVWTVTVDNENRHHNHALDEEIYKSYKTASKITDEILFRMVAGMIAANGNSRLICDYISRMLGRRFTSQQLNNFRNYRLGGPDAVSSMKGLLKQFTLPDGARLLVIQDEEGFMTGLAIQSKIQREMVRRWGDSLLLDWTHNTNNAGYYMGSLMVTTVNGTGVSVVDFLCLTQSKQMMRTIFKQCIDWEPTLLDNLRSVVIDKDYNEWAVLEELFPNADVVLCQFHVLKWFKKVIAQAKYNIPLAAREDVLAVLRAQVYAVDEEEFAHQRMRLAELFRAPRDQKFLDYMNDRWYSCVKMWSYAGRGKNFTAANTTTNRLEAFWRHYKEVLGKKQRIDLCLEALFVHATSVLRREKAFLVDYKSKTILYRNLDPFLRPLFRQLSRYAAKLVRSQYNKFKASAVVGGIQRYSAESVASDERRIKVRVVGARTIEEEVFVDGARPWTCTCSFNKGCSLPCRHILFVASTHRKLEAFPTSALSARWSLGAAVSILDTLQVAIGEVAALRIPRRRRASKGARTGLISTESTDVDAAWAASCNQRTVSLKPGSLAKHPHKPVSMLTLPRDKVGKTAVLDDIEKRNVVSTLLDRIVRYMMVQGTTRFRSCFSELEVVLDALLASWQVKPAQRSSNTKASVGDACDDNACDDDTQAMSPTELPDESSTVQSTDEVQGELPDELSDELLDDWLEGVYDELEDDMHDEMGGSEQQSFEPLADQVQCFFEEDCSASPCDNEVGVRFPSVDSPLSSPGATELFGGFDFEVTQAALHSAAVLGAATTNGFFPLTPPPSVVREFQCQRSAVGHSTQPSSCVARPTGLSDGAEQVLRELDDGHIEEEVSNSASTTQIPSSRSLSMADLLVGGEKEETARPRTPDIAVGPDQNDEASELLVGGEKKTAGPRTPDIAVGPDQNDEASERLIGGEKKTARPRSAVGPDQNDEASELLVGGEKKTAGPRTPDIAVGPDQNDEASERLIGGEKKTARPRTPDVAVRPDQNDEGAVHMDVDFSVSVPNGLSHSSMQLLRSIDADLMREEEARLGVKREREDESQLCSDHANKYRRAADAEAIGNIVIRGPVSQGNRRRTGQSSSGQRRGSIPTTSKAKVPLKDALLAIDFSAIPDAIEALSNYHVTLTETGVLDRGAVCHRTFVASGTLQVSSVITRPVFNMLVAAIDRQKASDNVVEDEDGSEPNRSLEVTKEGCGRHQYVVKVDGADSPEFSEDTIELFREFYERQRHIEEFTKDMAWVEADVMWPAPSKREVREVPFLQAEVDELEGLKNSIGTQGLRREIRAVLDKSTLMTMLSAPGSNSQVPVNQLFGRLARTEKLSDSVVNLALHLLSSAYDDVVVIDSLAFGEKAFVNGELSSARGKNALPSRALKDTRVVIFPINLYDAHWGVVCVSLPAQPGATAFVYDPLVQGSWQQQFADVWESRCFPMLEAWAARDDTREGAVVDLTSYLRKKTLSKIDVVYPMTPKQSDGVSCGLFCVLQSYAYINDSYELQDFETLNRFQVKMMRLRLLWYLLRRSELSTDTMHMATAKSTMAKLE